MTNEDIAVQLADHEARLNVCEHREKKLEEQNDTLNKMAVSLTEIATKQNGMETAVGEIKADVSALKEKPAKRWEAVIGYILGALASGIVGYVLAQLLK